MLVLGAEQRFAFVLENRRWGQLHGVRVRVQGQNPRLGQQRPREAEQQQQGDMGTQGVHDAKMGVIPESSEDNVLRFNRSGPTLLLSFLVCLRFGPRPILFVLITTIPDLSLQHDQALGMLRVEWAAGKDMRTFRASAEQLLELARNLEVRSMLLNMNSFPDISVYDQVWLGVSWMPVLVKLPLARIVLAIHRRRVHNQLAVDSLIGMFRPFIKFDIQFFHASVPGLHWLCDYSDRLPALLAEWQAVHGPELPDAVAEPRALYRAQC